MPKSRRSDRTSTAITIATDANGNLIRSPQILITHGSNHRLRPQRPNGHPRRSDHQGSAGDTRAAFPIWPIFRSSAACSASTRVTQCPHRAAHHPDAVISRSRRADRLDQLPGNGADELVRRRHRQHSRSGARLGQSGIQRRPTPLIFPDLQPGAPDAAQLRQCSPCSRLVPPPAATAPAHFSRRPPRRSPAARPGNSNRPLLRNPQRASSCPPAPGMLPPTGRPGEPAPLRAADD